MRRAAAPRGRRVRTLLLLLLAVAGALLAGTAPASAHAALTGSDPQQGSVVEQAPAQVSLTFSEKVAMSDGSVRVFDPKGKQVDTGETSELGGTTYAVKLHAGLPNGTFTITYQVVSADGHPVSGAYTFSVGAPSKTTFAAPEQTAGGGVVGVLYGFARYMSYAGFILLVGGAAFVLACWQRGAGVRPVQRLVVSGWLALTAATLSMLLLRGSYTGSGKVGDIFDLSLLGDVLQTKTGAALVSRLLLLAAAALFIAVLFGAYARRDEPDEYEEEKEYEEEEEEEYEEKEYEGGEDTGEEDAGEKDPGDDEQSAEKRDLAFGLAIGGSVVAAGLAASWAMAEHASTGIQTGIAMPVDVVHLLAVAVWLGGLVALLVALFRAPVDAQIDTAAVRRFSRVAFGGVVVLAATGIYQSWRQVGTWSALTDTSYGQLLLVKIGLVILLLGIGWISRRWTAQLAETPAAEAVAESATVAEQRAGTKEPAAARKGSTAAEKASATVGKGSAAGAETSAAAGKGATATEEVSASVGRGSTATEETSATAGKGSTTVGKESAATEDTSAPVRKGSTTSEEAPAGGGDAKRAAQLARQRAAMTTARAKRLRGADPGRTGLRRSVLAEAGVAVVLLAVTTALTSAEPGRTVEEAKAATAAVQESGQAGALSLDISFDTGGEDGQGVVRVDLDPARVGANDMHVYVQRPNGRAFDIPEIKVAFTLEAKEIGPLPVVPDRISTGHWSASGVQIPMAGDWEVAVTVRTSDIDQVTVNKNAKIG
ncbi:copper resistance CopC/CopD family protein [Streptomyces sp. NPDC002845]